MNNIQKLACCGIFIGYLISGCKKETIEPIVSAQQATEKNILSSGNESKSSSSKKEDWVAKLRANNAQKNKTPRKENQKFGGTTELGSIKPSKMIARYYPVLETRRERAELKVNQSRLNRNSQQSVILNSKIQEIPPYSGNHNNVQLNVNLPSSSSNQNSSNQEN